MDAQPELPSNIRRKVLLLAAFVAFAIHLPNLSHSFAWDDHYLVVHNPAVHSFEDAASWWTQPWAAGADSEQGRSQNALYWRPLTQASYALDWVVGGGSPALFHATNNLLHALSAALVALLAMGLATRLPRAPLTGRAAAAAGGIAGLVFAVHAVHSEAVHLITYRTTLIASAGVLGALCVHVARPRGAPLIVALLLALGLMGKEDALVLPGLLIVVDVALGRHRSDWRDLLRRHAPAWVVVAGHLTIRSALTASAPLDFFAGQDLATKVWTMASVYLLDLRLLILPWPLTPFYDWSLVPYLDSLFAPEAFLGTMLLLATILGGMYAWRRDHALGILTAGFLLVALTPYSHVLTFFDVAGERFLYLPSVALCLGVGLVAGPRVLNGRRTLPWRAGVAGLLVLLATLTVLRTPDFATTRDLLNATTRDFPHAFSARYELGRLDLLDERPADAAEHFRVAYTNLPLPVAALCLAEALRRDGRDVEGRAFLSAEVQRMGSRAPAIYAATAREGGGQSPPPIQCDLNVPLEGGR